jgi:hypothetical protein
MIERCCKLNLWRCLHFGAAALMAVSASNAKARNVKELAQGALIGAGIAVLVDGPGRGVLTGATAGILVAAISRRGRSD